MGGADGDRRQRLRFRRPAVGTAGRTVVVPFLGPTEAAVGAYRSLDGGATWTAITTISQVSFHPEAGGLRSSPLPTAEIDGNGRVFVAWSDCSVPERLYGQRHRHEHLHRRGGLVGGGQIPIDAVSGPVDHFIPGLAVDASTGDATARLGLSCSFATCELDVGSVPSTPRS